MPTRKDNVYIIGPLGAGKSSIGCKVARLLGIDFFDSDREIEKRSGVDIDWMFAVEGEAGFRTRELNVIEELTSQQGIVIATGGGTISIPRCREILKKRGTVVYLQVPFSEQLTRVKRFPFKRPMLKSNPEKKLKKLNEQREALYESIADLTYLNCISNPQQLAKKIVQDINELPED